MANLGSKLSLNKVEQLIARLGRAGLTEEACLQLLRNDGLVQRTVKFILEEIAKEAHEHYVVHVEYNLPRNKEEWRKRFDVVDASLFESVWQDDSSCKDIDRTSGPRTFALRRFADKMREQEIMHLAHTEGFRAATLVEALSFAAAHPDLQRKFTIAIVGSFSHELGQRRRVPMLVGSPDRREIREHLCSDLPWPKNTRFLFVRK